ncbi:MAG: sporulation protein YunB [Syntrophomonadaceae bacterium]|nr:sporulation protein YunB [Syntrophomonadaceae bacterium]
MYYRRKAKIIVFILIIILTASFIFIDYRVKASLLELARTQAEIRTMEIVTQAVCDKVVGETEYKDIVYIHKDDQGRIVMLQANTVILNQLMARTTKAILQGFKTSDADQIRIPLGQITGITLLAGKGPRFTVKVIPASQIYVAVDDKFEQAGINQTRHRIYMRVKTRIKMAVPFMYKDLNVVTTIPMAETIIVGNVPQTYVNLNGSDNTLYPLSNHKEP